MAQLKKIIVFVVAWQMITAFFMLFIAWFVAAVTPCTFQDVTTCFLFWVTAVIAFAIFGFVTGDAIWPDKKEETQSIEQLNQSIEIEKKRQELRALEGKVHFSM